MDELKSIMEKFAASGWERIAAPARAWLEGRADHDALVAAIRQADQGVAAAAAASWTPLYKRALALLGA